MEPPIQGLNLLSMVLLLAISFRRMLWGGGRGGGVRGVVLLPHSQVHLQNAVLCKQLNGGFALSWTDTTGGAKRGAPPSQVSSPRLSAGSWPGGPSGLPRSWPSVPWLPAQPLPASPWHGEGRRGRRLLSCRGTHRGRLLGQFPVQPVREALEQSVSPGDDDAAVQALRGGGVGGAGGVGGSTLCPGDFAIEGAVCPPALPAPHRSACWGQTFLGNEAGEIQGGPISLGGTSQRRRIQPKELQGRRFCPAPGVAHTVPLPEGAPALPQTRVPAEGVVAQGLCPDRRLPPPRPGLCPQLPRGGSDSPAGCRCRTSRCWS